jgi:acyl-CoA synthetase (NDP forming)
MSVASVIATARAEGRTLLNEVEAKRLLGEAGVPVAQTELAASASEARNLADALGYPVVMKIVSRDIAHKSDVGGVRLGIADADQVEATFAEVMDNVRKRVPDARIDGVAIQPMAEVGVEVIVGMTTDPQFGPVVMFGLGGVLVEVMKDVAFRIVPLEQRDARQMIDEIRGRAILDGVRGRPAVDREAIVDALLRVSAFVERHPEVREVDLNPMFVYPSGALAVDARIVLTD